MNKLVSKNSVQRFKQGKKIVKAKGGLRTKYFPEEFDKDYTHNFLTLLRLGYRKINGVWMSPEEQEQNRKATNKKGTKVIITPRFLSKYANMANTIGGANNIRAWQQKLKNYYAPGTYNPDSVWGDNTQAAYERYLAEQNNNLGLVKLEPVSISPVKESVQQNDFAQDKQTGYPSMETIQSSNPVLNQQNDFASDRQNYYPSATTNIVSYNPNFNWRNALAESQKLHFVKQGGQLPSRNPVERFKQGKKIVKAQQ